MHTLENTFKKNSIDEQEKFWLNKFRNEMPVLKINTDKPRRINDSFKINRVKFKIDNYYTSKLNNIAIELNFELHTILLTAYKILLYKHTFQNDIIIGIPISIKNNDRMKDINILPIRSNLGDGLSVNEYLVQIKDELSKLYENNEYPFEKLLEKLKIKRDSIRNPLFDTMFVFDRSINHDKLETLDIQHDFTLFIENRQSYLSCSIEYNTKLYYKNSIVYFSKHFLNIIKQIINDISIKIKDIDVLSDDEKNNLIYKMNNTKTFYHKDKLIHQLFEEQVEKTPENIALVFEDKKMTYKELNEKSNQIALLIREKGLKPDDIVGIMLNRSFDMVISIFGVLKAGCAYLPIDPDYPSERIGFIIEDSKTSVVLTQSDIKFKLNNNSINTIELDNKSIYPKDMNNLPIINTPSSLAYVMYTSGSSGKPKGVMIEHRSVNNFIKGITDKIDFQSEDTILSLTTISFDISVLENILPLTKGLKIVIANKDEQKNPEKLVNLIEKNNIDLLQTTPSRLQLILIVIENQNSLSKLKNIMIGGENFSIQLVDRLRKYSNAKIYNMYGPTETTVWSSVKDITLDKIVGIGSPIANTQIYILDKNNNLCPFGVAGELCISGDGLARGYLNRKDLTNERFINNPFIKDKKLYKTGDLAKILYDGRIEFLGRIDHQVKIRGFRIELGEIEKNLNIHPDIKESVVIDKVDKDSNNFLCAYIVSDKEININEIRSFLGNSLPDYMIPSYFIYLSEIPITHNGKVDRKSLPEISNNINTGIDYVPPKTTIEKELTKIWEDILCINKIGVNDNFFNTGGHSLKVLSLISDIHKHFKVKVPIKKLFKNPTIKDISTYIEKANKNDYIKIKQVDKNKYYKTSSNQIQMYILNEIKQKQIIYNIPFVIKIKGKVNIEKLNYAYSEVIKRHEILRTNFDNIDNMIVQIVNNNENCKIEYIKINEDGLEERLYSFINPFDLQKDQLIRVKLINTDDKTNYLFVDIHHIIFDGLSQNIFIDELFSIYDSNNLNSLKIQYKDYSEWQNRLLKSNYIKKQEKYWLNKFKDGIPVLNFSTDYPRIEKDSFEGNNIQFNINNYKTNELKKIAKSLNITLHMLMLTIYKVLLYKYTYENDIIVGIPVSIRNNNELKNIIGMFVNTLPIRSYPEDESFIIDYLLQIKDELLESYENNEYPFEELVKKLNIQRDSTRNPLFDTMFVFDHVENEIKYSKDLEISEYKDFKNKIAKFDFSLFVEEHKNHLSCNIEYNTEFYNQNTMIGFSRHFMNIINQIISDINVKIKDLNILSDEEKNSIINDFNNTKVDFQEEKLAHQLFEEQVEKTPDNIALIFNEKKMTYKELNEKSNQIASLLREKGVKPDEIIGIMVNRSFDIMTGILGVLKAGCAYLPIDPDYPLERIDYLIEDSKTSIVLTQSNIKDKLPENKVEIIELDDKSIHQREVTNLPVISNSRNIAYIIYTSGSTGKPKGVMIEHRSLVNLITCLQKRYPLDSNDAYLLMANYVFDGSISTVFGWFLDGGKLVLMEKDYNNMLDKIIEHNVTHLMLVPSMFNTLLLSSINDNISALSRLKCLFLGGEKLNISLVKKAYELIGNFNLVNRYGPTESTVCVTNYILNNKVPNTQSVPIGKPLDNIKIYILDNNNICPIGVVGEICISGKGLARGYLNKKELTKEKFINNPFSKCERMYKTGDLAKWLPGGNIEFMERKDNQIKIRGYRIELGEIENNLLSYKDIKHLVVLDKELNDNNKYLCAYYVSDKKLSDEEIKKYLNNKLPEYMIPQFFIRIENIPLNYNGKIDKKALLKINITRSKSKCEKPNNQIEEKLLEIWKDILKIDNQISTNDNFFNIGGHSLKAVILISKIYKTFNIKITLKDIFDNPTIKLLSDYMNKLDKKVYNSIKQVQNKEYYELSPAQNSLFIINQIENNTAYNMPYIYKLNGNINKNDLETAFKKLIDRHESLRTSFEFQNDRPFQRIHKDYSFNIVYLQANGESILDIIDKSIKPFNLNEAPILRVKLIELNKGKYILFIDMHHIISDGLSIKIFIEELVKLYNGENLKNINIQYKDYSEWKNNTLKSEESENQERFWLSKLKGELPILDLPLDNTRPVIQDFNGDNIMFTLGKESTKKLKEMCNEYNVTLYMLLLAIYAIMLNKYTSQEDIIIGSSVSGRSHPDLENIIGMFVNTIAMRNYINIDSTFIEFLNEARQNCLESFLNQDYPFEKLVDKLNINRNAAINPVFSTMFDYHTYSENKIKFKDFTLIRYPYEHNVSKVDLSFDVMENSDDLNFILVYSSCLFKKETIEKLKDHFINLINNVISNPEKKIFELDMLTEEEKKMILAYSQFDDEDDEE